MEVKRERVFGIFIRGMYAKEALDFAWDIHKHNFDMCGIKKKDLKIMKTKTGEITPMVSKLDYVRSWPKGFSRCFLWTVYFKVGKLKG